MDDTKVFISEFKDEWYGIFFMCRNCKCHFMTLLYSVKESTSPHNYCPNCGVKFNESELWSTY